jgi:hypothetical protein
MYFGFTSEFIVKPKPLKFCIAITVQRLNFGVFFVEYGRFWIERTEPFVMLPLRFKAGKKNKKN